MSRANKLVEIDHKIEFYNTTTENIEQLDADEFMNPGMGFWIYPNEECEWVVLP